MERFNRFFKANRRLGLRIVKTGIAVTVCVAISRLLLSNQPFISVIAAVMSMGKSIDFSVRAGKNKMIGAVIGSSVGCAFAALSPGNAGLCGIGIILSLYLCHLLRMDDAGPLSSIAFAAVLFRAPQADPWTYALPCAGNALIGIAAAVAVNLIVLPPNYAVEIKNAFAELQARTEAAVRDAAERRTVGTRPVSACIELLASNIHLYVSEAKLLRWNDDEVFSISSKIATYRMVLDELKAVEVMELTEKGDPEGESLTVYNYHMRRMRELLRSVQDAPGPGSPDS